MRLVIVAVLAVIGTCIAMDHIPMLKHNAFYLSASFGMTYGVVVFFCLVIIAAFLLRKA